MVGERESEKAQLSVFERPVFLQRPVNQVVLVDEAVEFRCQVRGDPPPTLRWKKEDVEIPRGRLLITLWLQFYLRTTINSPVRINGEVDHRHCPPPCLPTCVVPSTSPPLDSRNMSYFQTCLASLPSFHFFFHVTLPGRLKSGSGMCREWSPLHTLDRPNNSPIDILPTPSETSISKWDFFSPLATCLCLTCLPPLNPYGWPDNFTGSLTPNGAPERESPTPGSSALCVCSPSKALIYTLVDEMFLPLSLRHCCLARTVLVKWRASAYLTIREAPQFVVRPRDQIVAQGRTAAFPCETRGKPQPTVFWQREGSQDLLFPNEPTQGESRVSVSMTGELTISSVQRSDAGYYICQALTVAGSIMAKAQLEVADALKDRPPPIIRQGPSNQTQAVGGVSLLRCQASGDPEPTVTWRKNGASLLGKDPRFSLLEHGSLQIQNTRLSDLGLYTCVATSSSGETSWSAYLDVTDSTDLSDFMSHNATALPGPPSKPEVTDVTKSSISLSWEPGPEAGSPVSSYVIEAFG
ncbi:hypothetical protein KUCAC02_003097, partial [Chaenocephalus aceratus]